MTSKKRAAGWPSAKLRKGVLRWVRAYDDQVLQAGIARRLPTMPRPEVQGDLTAVGMYALELARGCWDARGPLVGVFMWLIHAIRCLDWAAKESEIAETDVIPTPGAEG